MAVKSFNARTGLSVGATPVEIISQNGAVTLPAGTTTLAPLKFAAGVALSTPQVGAVDFDGTALNLTITGAIRKALAFTDSNITGTAANITGTLAVAQGGTGATTVTGTGANVLGTSPTLVTPKVDSIQATGTGVNPSLWGDVTTGQISIGSGLNGGSVVIGTANGNTTVAGSLTVTGDLTVNGTVTTVNSTTVSVDDKNIELGSVASPTNATADGGGITLKGTTDKTILWDNANGNWTSSENWNLLTGKVFKINNVTVLSSTTLGSSVVNSSLTSVGTLTSLTTSGQITSTVANGTAPLVVASSTQVANLNAQFAGTATNIAGGATGDFVYQTGAGATGFRTATQVTAALDTFTSALKGLVPASGGGTTNFLRADGTWAPVGAGTVSTVAIANANGVSGTVIHSAGTATITLSLGAITPTSVTATGALQGSNLVVGNNLTTTDIISAGNILVERAGALTTAATAVVNLDTWAVANFRSAKYLVQAVNTVTGDTYITEILVTRDNANNVFITEYGSINSGAAVATFDADYDGSANVRLRVTPALANSTQFKFSAKIIRA